jgi:hypothetical protein
MIFCMSVITISCGECVMEGTSACEGCVVTYICDREPDDAVVIDVAEERALRILGRGGLLPPLRHRRDVPA